MFIVGPAVSNHIQMWYQKKLSSACVRDAVLMTVHPGGRKFNSDIKVLSYDFTKSRIDFFLFIPFFILRWWWQRPKVTNFHYLSSYGLLSLLVPQKNLTLNTWGSDVNLVYSSKSVIKRWLVKKSLQRFNWINTPAQHLKDKLITLGANPESIHVYQYGVEVDKLEKIADNTTIVNSETVFFFIIFPFDTSNSVN